MRGFGFRVLGFRVGLGFRGVGCRDRASKPADSDFCTMRKTYGAERC